MSVDPKDIVWKTYYSGKRVQMEMCNIRTGHTLYAVGSMGDEARLRAELVESMNADAKLGK